MLHDREIDNKSTSSKKLMSIVTFVLQPDYSIPTIMSANLQKRLEARESHKKKAKSKSTPKKKKAAPKKNNVVKRLS